MTQHYLALSSITYAYKAKSYLFQRGIESSVVKTPKKLSSSGGCGYSLKVSEDPDYVANLLRSSGFEVVSIL